MNKPKQLIIIGGGASINEGIKKELWKKLEGKFVCGINFSYIYFSDATIQFYLDKQVRDKNEKDFDTLPLIITKNQAIKTYLNELQLSTHNQYDRHLKDGVYKGSLTGIYALTVAIHLLDEGEIFLLGYDFGSDGKDDKTNKEITHFYQGEINHRGVGKINYYKGKERANRDFGVYNNEKKIKIYNVSLDSKINTFEKISYDEFFKKIDGEIYNKNELRGWIKNILNKHINNKPK